MGPIEALEHLERAANLHFLCENGALGVGGPVRRQAVNEILGKPFEGQAHPLDGTPLHVDEVVDGDPVDLRLEPAARVELRKPGDRTNENLLCRILGILAVPQHAESQAVPVALQRPDQLVESVAIAVDRQSGEVFRGARPASPFHQRLQRRQLGLQLSALSLEGTFNLFERHRGRVQNEAVDARATSRLGHSRLGDSNCAVGKHEAPVYDARLGVGRHAQTDIDRSAGRLEARAIVGGGNEGVCPLRQVCRLLQKLEHLVAWGNDLDSLTSNIRMSGLLVVYQMRLLHLTRERSDV
jgi:hypothetical protein